MIKPKRMNAVMLTVRDIKKSMAWYREHFGFEKLYDVPGGILIGADGVELVLSQAEKSKQSAAYSTEKNVQIKKFGLEVNVQKLERPNDIAIRLFGLEISADDLAKIEEEFPEDDDIVRIDHPRYQSCIVEDPDGHSIELYIDKS